MVRSSDRADAIGPRRDAGTAANIACGKRRISGTRRRLYCLPYDTRRQVVRRRPRDADAIWHALHLEHHARPGNRNRQLDRRPVLWGDAHRPVSRWRLDVSGDAFRLLYKSHARRQRCDLCLSENNCTRTPAQSPARSNVSLQQSLADSRMAYALFQSGNVSAGRLQIR